MMHILTSNTKNLDDFVKTAKELSKIRPEDEYIKQMTRVKSINDIYKPMNRFSDCTDWPNGFYFSPSFNLMEALIKLPTNKYIEDTYSFSRHTLTEEIENERANYGVCDSFTDILKEYPELINSSRKFFVVVTPIYKSNEPAQDGWRWEKWGEYIGTQNSQADYIHDEPEIERVFVYHIYEVV